MRAQFLRTAVAALTVSAAAGSCILFAPLGLDALSESRVRALCHLAFACCTPAERGRFLAAPFKDEGACVAEVMEDAGLSGALFNGEAVAKDAVARGVAEFDAEAAERCSRPLLDAANSCDGAQFVGAGGNFDFTRVFFLVDPADAECAALALRHFARGNVDDGDDCLSDVDCADFGSCQPDPDDVDTLTTRGTCVALPGKGDSCADIFACQPGLTCTAGAGGELTCEEPDLLNDGEPCGGDAQCESGFCESVEIRTCFNAGTPCVDDADCDPTDFCSFDSFEQTCAQRPDIVVEICDGQ